MSEYLSLYDFLGRAAGPKLGEEVKQYADEQFVPFKIREINNPKFTGKVILYPKNFLELYFREPYMEHQDEPTDDLPF